MIELVCTCDFPSVSLGISPTLGYLVRLERRHEVFVTGRHPKEDV